MKISKEQLFESIINSYRAGGGIIACGNGGSATQSNHLVEELVGRYKNDRIPIKGLSLSSDSSIITCIGNDYGFEYIFSRQIECLASINDILLCFSTSGKSKNIINVLQKAKTLNIQAILITGDNYFDETNDFVYYSVGEKEGRRIQEEHLVLIHDIIENIELNLIK